MKYFKLFEAFVNGSINEDKEYDKLHTKAMDMSNKFTPEERARYKELSIEQYPIVIKKLPGDIYEIKTVGGGDTALQGDLLAEYNREELLAKIKNPKGIHLDNRRNDGGQQPPFKAILDFFVETPEDKDGNRKIPIEQQTDYWPTDEWTDEDKERGYESKINYLESKIEDKNKFTNIPTIVSTSDWTFSGGEFLTDTLKNFGKENITHVGSNSGGGANRTSSTADDMAKTWPDEDPNAKGLKVEEKLERSLKVFEKFYIDKEQAKEVRESIMKDPSKYIKDGKINEKAVEDNMRKITKDFHVSYFTDDDGRIEVMAPYGKSDRIVTDKNGKPIGPPYEFKGNWEGTGTGNAVPGIGMTETDPDTAKNSALELLYTKTGQKDQLAKMKSNPEEFGLTEDGKDDWYTRGTLEDREAGKDVYYPGYAADGVHPKMWKESQHAAEENKKNWVSILKAADGGKNIDDKSKDEPENWWEEYSDEAKDAYMKKHGEAPDVGNKISLSTEKQTIMKHIKLFEQFMNEASSRINITGLDSKEIKGLKQWGDAKVAGPGVYFTFLDKDKEEILNYLNNIDSADFDKSLLEGVIEEGINDPGILKAFFMAGGPGSGKSYVASELFGFPKRGASTVSYATGLKLINNDNAFEKGVKDAGLELSKLADYAKDEETWSKVMTIRDHAKSLTRKIQSNYINGRLGQVIDGTGKDFDKIAKMRKMYKNLGYDTFMVFVNTSLEVAQERNKMRERKLDDKMVEKMWKAVQDNLGKFQKEFGTDKMIIVDNNATDSEESVLDQIEKQISRRLNRPISNPLGKRWIEDNTPGQRNESVVTEKLSSKEEKDIKSFIKNAIGKKVKLTTVEFDGKTEVEDKFLKASWGDNAYKVDYMAIDFDQEMDTIKAGDGEITKLNNNEFTWKIGDRNGSTFSIKII